MHKMTREQWMYLGLAGLGGLLLFNGKEVVVQTVNALVGAGKDMGTDLYSTLHHDWSEHPDEALWETPYWSLKDKQYRAFYGHKPMQTIFNHPPILMPPGAKIKYNTISIASPAVRGTLEPRPGAGQYTLHYNHGRAGTLRGDPRFLYSLDHLMRISGLRKLDHLGVLPQTFVGPGKAGDTGHQSGCAIDLTDDGQMNALVEAAKVAHMPICWISKGRVEGKGWPFYLLARGVKQGPIGWSPENHNDHFHLMLPRPNWSARFFNK